MYIISYDNILSLKGILPGNIYEEWDLLGHCQWKLVGLVVLMAEKFPSFHLLQQILLTGH